MLELVEQLLRSQVLALQRADELQQVLIGDDVRRRGRQFSKQMIDQRPLQPVAFARKVDDTVGCVGQDIRRWGAVEALEVDRRLQQ